MPHKRPLSPAFHNSAHLVPLQGALSLQVPLGGEGGDKTVSLFPQKSTYTNDRGLQTVFIGLKLQSPTSGLNHKNWPLCVSLLALLSMDT